MADEKSTVRELLSDDSFVRWAKGTADNQEALGWDAWCNKSEFNRKLAVKAQSILFEVTPTYSHQVDSEKEWRFLHERIRNSSKNRLNRLSRLRKVQPAVWWYRAAAVFLIAAIVGIITYELQSPQEVEPVQEEIVWKQIKTDYGEHKTITLSDGSSIILNAHSSLKYPAGWVQGEAIEVQLNGEAYFDITKRTSADAPSFNVKTFGGTVQVMGTSFVVDTEEKRTRVGLEEGAVKIIKANVQSKGEESIWLEPSQLAEFSRFDESVEIHKVNPQTFTSWTRQVLVMDNTPLSDLVDRIRKTYGVEVKVKDPALYERRLTGSANLKDLNLLIQAISEVMEINVRKSGDTVIFGS